MSLTRVGMTVALLILSGCVLRASAFLPRTGGYVYVAEESADGGERVSEELFRVFVVTADQGPIRASVQVPKTDAGQSASDPDPTLGQSWPRPENARRATLVVVDPDSGDLVDDDSPPNVYLPGKVVVGSRWRANPGSADSCAIDGRVTKVAGDVVHIVYDLVCGGTTAPLVQLSWQTGRGLVESRSPDGATIVHFTPE